MKGMSKAWERAIRAAREADRKTRAKLGDCRCAGPDYHPDKPCPVHPKLGATPEGKP